MITFSISKYFLQINFAGMNQKIIAAEAPKKNMVPGFWQMILDNKVTVIVMITDMVENDKVKAHAYWPHEKDVPLHLENDIKVLLSDEATDKGLIRRTFVIGNASEFY